MDDVSADSSGFEDEAASVRSLDGLHPCVARRTIELVTEGAFDVTDVTDDCLDLIASCGVQEGTLGVFTGHTTCAVTINEPETGLLEDLRLLLGRLIPASAYYRHNDFGIRDPETLMDEPVDEPANAHAHLAQMLLGCASAAVPIIGGRLGLGRWQRILFIELDQARPRRVHLHIHGWR
jgi:secondary thiamine-phosphate synthase enzyme